VTPSALSVLQQIDVSLEEIGLFHSPATSRTRSSQTISEISEHESEELQPIFIEEDGLEKRSSYLPRNKHIQRVHRDDFHRVCKIGRGGYSDVYMVLDHKREKCALKALNASRLKTSETFVTAAIDLAMEAKILSELNHENIIQLRGICSSAFSTSYTEDTHEGYFLVFDLLNDVLSDRLDRWKKDARHFSTFESKWPSGKAKVNNIMMYRRIQSASLGMVKGMKYLHEKEIVLRDLKPANVGFDEEANVRLFDFGMARKLEDCDPDEICGSPRYMPPEVTSGKGYSLKTDVYSFGIILYEICSLNRAFDAMGKYSDRKKINRLIIEENHRPKLNKIACPRTKKLIKDCWQADPTKRPSFIEIHERIIDIIS
jgi:serine/threonine protein kinase